MLNVNKVYLGDCLEVMKSIDDESVDMILCDLPYGTTACKWDSIIPLDLLWEQYLRIIKPNAAMVFTASQPFTTKLIGSQIEKFKHHWIWEKNKGSNFASIKYGPFKEHEDICVFEKNGKRVQYFPQMQKRKGSGAKRCEHTFQHESNEEQLKNEVYGGIRKQENGKTFNPNQRFPSSVQKFNCQQGKHPTQKPVALFEYLIKTYTDEGMLVLDNCIGSGTTAIACMNTARQFIGIEKEEKYFLIANERIIKHVLENRPA